MTRKNEIRITVSDNERARIIKKAKEMAKKTGVDKVALATYARIAALNYKG